MIKNLLRVIILTICIQVTLSQLTIKRLSEITSSSKCLIHIINTYFKQARKLSIRSGFDSKEITTEILKNINVPVVIDAVENAKVSGIDERVPTDFVITLNLINIDLINVDEIINSTLWYANTRFLIVLKSVQYLKVIFECFWSRKIINAFALVEKDGGSMFYGFLPYVKNCSVGDPILLDDWKDGRFHIGGISEIEKNVRIWNMYNCAINVSTVDLKPFVIFDNIPVTGIKVIDGVEGKMMKEISRIMNFNATYFLPRDGEIWGWVKPKPGGAVGDLYVGYSEFAVGMLGPVMDRVENLDLSVTYTPLECVTFAVPKGIWEEQDAWIMILVSEFTHIMWSFIVMSVVLSGFSFWLFDHFSPTRNFFPSKSAIVLYVYYLFFCGSVKKPSLWILRALFVCYAWFSFIITTAYQSSMGSLLTVPTADKDVETFAQLLETKLELRGYKNMYTTMSYNRIDPNINRMLNRFVVTNQTLENAIERMATYRDIAYIKHISQFIYYSLVQRHKGTTNVLKDCIYVYYPTLMLKKYSPLTNRVNDIINYLVVGGIVQHWRSEYIHDVPRYPNPVVKLSVEHMKGILFVVIFGLGLATVIFVLELIYFRVSGSSSGRKFKRLSLIQEKMLLIK